MIYGAFSLEDNSNIIQDITININDSGYNFEDLKSIEVMPGQELPVQIMFTAVQDTDEVRLNLLLEGEDIYIYESSPKFTILKGRRYITRFTLNVPKSVNSGYYNLILTASYKDGDVRRRNEFETPVYINVINNQTPVIPEFNFFVIVLTTAGSIITFFIIRKR